MLEALEVRGHAVPQAHEELSRLHHVMTLVAGDARSTVRDDRLGAHEQAARREPGILFHGRRHAGATHPHLAPGLVGMGTTRPFRGRVTPRRR